MGVRFASRSVQWALVIALVLPAGILGPRLQQASASLRLSPTSGLEGDRITGTGSDFMPGDIELFLDEIQGTLLGGAAVDRNGGFTIRFDVPRGVATGDHNVIACRDRTASECRETARAILTVDPPPTTTTTQPPSTTTTAPPTSTTSRLPTTTTSTRPPTTTTTTPSTSTTTTSSPTLTTTSTQAPVGISTTSTTSQGVIGVSTTVGGFPSAPPSTIGDLFATSTIPPGPGAYTPVDDVDDIQLDHVEVTQGLQNLANEFPLVSGRDFVVRLHGTTVNGETQPGVTGMVQVLNASGDVLHTEFAGNPGVTFNSQLNRLSNDHVPWVRLPSQFATGTKTIRGFVWVIGDETGQGDGSPGNNIESVTVEFSPTDPFDLWYWPVYMTENFEPGGDPEIWNPGDGWLAEHAAAYHSWPISSLGGHPQFAVVGDASSNWDLSSLGVSYEVNLALIEEFVDSGLDADHNLYVGAVAADLDEIAGAWGQATTYEGNVAVWATMGILEGAKPETPWFNRSGVTIAHEGGHAFGLAHAPCNANDEGTPAELGGGAIDPFFPEAYGWPSCSLAPTDETGFFGIEYLFPMAADEPPTILSNDSSTPHPNRAFPLMGYQTPQSFDPWHGCQILDALGVDCDPTELQGLGDDPTPGTFFPTIPTPSNGGLPAFNCNDVITEVDMCQIQPAGGNDPIEFGGDDDLIVSLVVGLETGRSEILRVLPVAGRLVDSLPLTGDTREGGPYVLAVVDAADVAIWAATLDIFTDAAHGGVGGAGHDRGVVTRIPDLPDAARLVLVSPEGTLAERSPSNTPPSVTITEATLDDGLIVAWQTSDADGDVVTVSADYRPHADAPWLALASGTTQDSLFVDNLVNLAASEAGEIRVVATDGWHAAVATKEIVVPPQAPFVGIMSPADGFTAPEGRWVPLRAMVVDADDDTVSIAWVSDRNGEVATGEAVGVNTLTQGVHSLSVVVTDAAGMTATASVEVVIGPTDLPPAAMQAAALATIGDGEPGSSSVAPIVIAVVVAVLGAGAFTLRRKTA